MRALALALGVVVLGGCNGSGGGDAPVDAPGKTTSIELIAADGVKVHAERYQPAERGRVIALLFHQAGSNCGEYAEIAPKLVERGIECLAVDLRSGGNMWGRDNKTAVDSGKSDWTYMEAYQDMAAAFEWAKKKDYGKIVVWGSSYSASLAFKLASENQVSAVVAFSPGEYFDDKKIVSKWNSEVRTPCFFAFSEKEAMDGGFSLQQSAPKVVERIKDVIASDKGGVHGSSMLIKDKCPKAYGFYWQKLNEFFDSQKIGAKPEKP